MSLSREDLIYNVITDFCARLPDSSLNAHILYSQRSRLAQAIDAALYEQTKPIAKNGESE